MAAFTCSSVNAVLRATAGPATSASLARHPCRPALPSSSAVMAVVLPRPAGEGSSRAADRRSTAVDQPLGDVVGVGDVRVVPVLVRPAERRTAVVVVRGAQVLGVDVRVV